MMRATVDSLNCDQSGMRFLTITSMDGVLAAMALKSTKSGIQADSPYQNANTSEAPPVRLVGYCRVSTEDQNCDMQKAALLASGVPEEWIYIEVESGRKAKRPELINALKCCRPGGELRFWKTDRLGRDLVEVLQTLKRLEDRGVRYRSLTEPHVTPESRQTAAGNAFIQMTLMFAEMESKLIGERTRAGQRAAKNRGVRFGRKTFHELYVDTGRVAAFQRDLRDSGDPVEVVRKRQKPAIPLGTFKKWYRIFVVEPATDAMDIDEAFGGATVEDV